MRVARATRLMDQERRLTLNATAEVEVIGHAVNGLKHGHSLLVNSWALEEARGKAIRGRGSDDVIEFRESPTQA